MFNTIRDAFVVVDRGQPFVTRLSIGLAMCACVCMYKMYV